MLPARNLALLLLGVATLRCSPAQDGPPSPSAGSSTVPSAGGNTATGGSSGGTTSSLGGAVSGGTTTSGGLAAGGSSALGGSSNSGGSGGGSAGLNQGGAQSGGTSAANGGSGGASAGSTGGGVPGLGSCQLATGADFANTQVVYEKWKTDLLTADGAGGFLRVRRPNSGTQVNSSNSEGIAYGMLISVYMGDQDTFDKLWQYEQKHLGKNGLMEWEIGPNGDTIGSGAASDGDVDMAFALIMADKKWGGRGSLSDSYLNYAKKQVDLIWRFEIDHNRGDVLTPGDNFADGSVINISYFAPAYFRAFGQVTGKTAEWNRAVKTTYDVIEATLNSANKNSTNGLVPAWSTPSGTPMAPPGSGHPTHHQLDSCRTPFRLAQDYCWYNEPRALSYLKKINAFYANIGAANIVDGYNLDGTVFQGANLHLAAFVGGAGVGALATPEHAKLRDDAYTGLAAWQAYIGGSQYYNKSWTMLSLLMMTGKFADLSQSAAAPL